MGSILAWNRLGREGETMKKLILALALVTTTSVAGQGMEPPQAPTAPAADSSATPARPGLVEDIIKLWKANLSEDFINKFVATADLAREITAEDVVRLRSAGVPETIIIALTHRKMEAAGGAAAGNAATPGSAAGGAAPLLVAPPASSRRWDGLVRRNSGIVLLKSRWDAGVLEFKDESLRWVDSKNLGKNVLVPARQITEQQLTCLKKSGGNECFEWVVKTKSDEFRFRDVGWRQVENAKVAEIFQFFKTLYPALVASQVPVDEK
jgi:hypothetical protein